MANSRDEFNRAVVDALGKRSAFICSNPDCRASTVAPSDIDEGKFLYIGTAAHICAAARGGPRYDIKMSPEQRKSATNGIFLCNNCAVMIDKNNGLDFTVPQLRQWKSDHEKWVTANLNKRQPDHILRVVKHQLRTYAYEGLVLREEDNPSRADAEKWCADSARFIKETLGDPAEFDYLHSADGAGKINLGIGDDIKRYLYIHAGHLKELAGRLGVSDLIQTEAEPLLPGDA